MNKQHIDALVKGDSDDVFSIFGKAGQVETMDAPCGGFSQSLELNLPPLAALIPERTESYDGWFQYGSAG